MKSIINDHIISILFVMLIFLVLFIVSMEIDSNKRVYIDARIQQYAGIKDINLEDPLEREMLQETLNIFYSKNKSVTDSITKSLNTFKSEQLSNINYKSGIPNNELSLSTIYELVWMYLKFVLVYIVVLWLNYYAAQTIAIYKFIKQKQPHVSHIKRFGTLYRDLISSDNNVAGRIVTIGRMINLIAIVIIAGLFYLLLFSPAYIIAYSMKSTFETGGYVLMIVLGVISNGLLINYAYKYYTYLVHESQKGYVQNAIVKGLNNSYLWNKENGISFRALLNVKKSFPFHVFQHIYSNASFQYIPTMKQQASFIITGLIIIEMALNIQGHLCYELLQTILYRQYNITLIIIFGIFVIVKMTEISVDYWNYTESKKYENK